MRVLHILEHNRRVAELMAEAQRRYGGHAELAEHRERFWWAGLNALEPLPNQPTDTQLDIGGTIISKRSSTPMHFYGRTSDIQRQPYGLVVVATVNCREASAAVLNKAFGRLHRVQLRQMRNPDLRTRRRGDRRRRRCQRRRGPS
jgi:hypothetical protein